MNCAWCGANADGSDSHGICDNCAIRMAYQSFVHSTPSYIEVNAAAFSEECNQVLEREAVQV